MGKTPVQAARDSAEEIAVPVLMATLTTVVVFFPITFMSGLGKYLFTPLAVSATLAMFASYIVSRTVSPLYCARYLRRDAAPERFPRWLLATGALVALVGLGFPLATVWGPRFFDLPAGVQDVLNWPFVNLPTLAQQAISGLGAVGAVIGLAAVIYGVAPLFQRFFDKVGGAYENTLRVCLRYRLAVVGIVLFLLVPAYWCFAHTGQELFPEVDASEFTIHLRATGGPRVEATENEVRKIEELVRQIIPEEDIDLIVSNIGINARWSAIYTPNNGPHAAFIRVQLRSGFSGRKTSALQYIERIRNKLARDYPGDDFYFETGGMIRRILNAGSIAPIQVMVHGRDPVVRRTLARQLDTRIGRIPHVKETYMPQGMDIPMFHVNVDRTKAQLLGFTESDAIRNVITTLMSSAQLAPNFWIDPSSGNPYIIGVQYPQHSVRDKHTLERIPISTERIRPDGTRFRPRLDQVATIERTQGPSEIYHYDIDRVSQIFVSVGDQDLAGVAQEIDRILAEFPLKHALRTLPTVYPDKKALIDDDQFQRRLGAFVREHKNVNRRKALGEAIQQDFGIDPDPLRLPAGVRFDVRGEVQSMRESFSAMTFNLLLAVLLLYLLMAAQFASWRDPLIMIVAAPLGLIGVVLTLWLTGTSLNIQSFMGILMMVGISHSNSTLIVDFANRRRKEGMDTFTAIIGAARVRLQPIIMTSLATVVGLAPLAIHFHPGDEMNLPLARAVIGGLFTSTLLTLFMVPILYVILKPRGPELATTPE
jgi:multidrug efflux pump subunit AcrB